jgi:hypothetical protein
MVYLACHRPEAVFIWVGSGAMTAILALFVSVMMLVIEIEQPLLMGGQQVFPGLRPLEMPVGEPSSINLIHKIAGILRAICALFKHKVKT